MKIQKLGYAIGMAVIILMFSANAWAGDRGRGGRVERYGNHGHKYGYSHKHPARPHYNYGRHYRPRHPHYRPPRYGHKYYPRRHFHKRYAPGYCRGGWNGYSMSFFVGDPNFSFGFSAGENW